MAINSLAATYTEQWDSATQNRPLQKLNLQGRKARHLYPKEKKKTWSAQSHRDGQMETWQGSNSMYHTVKREKFLPVAFQVCSQICPALLPAKAWAPKTLGKFQRDEARCRSQNPGGAHGSWLLGVTHSSTGTWRLQPAEGVQSCQKQSCQNSNNNKDPTSFWELGKLFCKPLAVVVRLSC